MDKRVLIVDDEKNMRWVLGQALTGEGFEVIEASDGAAAVRSVLPIPAVDTDYHDAGRPSADKVELALSVADTVSLEQPIGEDGAQLGDFIEDEDAADPVQMTEELDVANSLRISIERLPEREGRILALRYGFYDGVPRTLEEIGDEFNLTRERIRQLEKLALCRLRHPSFGIREADLV